MTDNHQIAHLIEIWLRRKALRLGGYQLQDEFRGCAINLCRSWGHDPQEWVIEKLPTKYYKAFNSNGGKMSTDMSIWIMAAGITNGNIDQNRIAILGSINYLYHILIR